MLHRSLLLVALIAAIALPASAQNGAADIAGYWAEAQIRDLLARNVVGTLPGGLFAPNAPLDRATYLRWLVTARGLPLVRPARPSFADVPATHLAWAHVESALAYDIVRPAPALGPDQPLPRGEAMVLLARTLGFTFESGWLAGAPLSFDDAATLAPDVRGAVAVATYSTPPLLREPPLPRFRAGEAITRGAGAALVWSYLWAVEREITVRAYAALGPGLELTMEKRGALRTTPLWRVQVGAFTVQDNAERVAAQMRDRGFPVIVEFLDGVYKVRIGDFATRPEADALRDQLRVDGAAAYTIQTLADYDRLAGPFWMLRLIVDPGQGVLLAPAAAQGGRERPSAIARRRGALVAINGGFFNWDGDPLGALMVNGELLSEPIPGRTSVGITPEGTLLFDTLRFEGLAIGPAGQAQIAGINRARKAGELILYRPGFGASTRQGSDGAEAAIAGGVVRAVADGQGNTPIPPDGVVLSGSGAGRTFVQSLRPGDRVEVRLRLTPESGDLRWARVIHVMTGGPRLLRGGQYAGGEGFARSMSDRRHPRTAIGTLPDGRIAIVVVDGREPYHSLGMTLPELAAEFTRLGATDALNFDGGGSVAFVVRGQVVNLPSDETGERPVTDVLLIYGPNGR